MKKYVLKGLGVLFLFLIQWAVIAQTDTLCGKKTYATVNLLYGTTYNAFNSSYSADQTAAQPFVTPQNMINGKFKMGMGVWSPWQLPPAPPTLIASQGDYKDQIRLSWEINPLSPRPTGFVLYRDGAFLENLDEDVTQYVDRFVQAGVFYQYSVAAKNAFGVGSTNKYVGFVYPNGVVSGKIETNSGNPVPDVEVRLTPITGNAMLFNGIDGQLCVSSNPNFLTSVFTVSAYVKFGTNTNDQAGIIDLGSTLNKNFWITTLPASEGKGYIFHIGNGTGSDTLQYKIPVNNANLLGNDEKWHQITMMYNGATMTVLVDGIFVGTKPCTMVMESKQRMTIGSKINDAYLKGLIDDIRIYDRQLTQTEINATKNRSISKNEKGLKGYWKMDEGLGTKTFDNSNSQATANMYGGVSFSADKPDVYNAGISDVTGYYLIDGINYSGTESFRATPMKNFEYNTALEFTAADKAYGNLTDFNIPDDATIEVLFHPFDLKSRQSILSKQNLFELYLLNGELFINLNGTTTNLGSIQAKYYLVSVVMNKTFGTAKVYIDDTFKTDITFAGTPFWQNGKPWVVATNDTTITGNFYTGLIDEIAIFKKQLSLPEIQLHSTVGIPDDSTRANLYSYFDFNEGTDTKVYDYYAASSDIGQPRIGTIKNATWSNNVRRKVTVPHEFQPNVRVVNLNNSNTAIGNIDFRDVSTVNISGTVRFINTFCFADQIEILVNGQSNFPPIKTDVKGKWSADFEPGANVVLKPVYKDHTFSPERIEYRRLQAPKAGIVFLDKTLRTVSGQVAGGLCKKSIITDGAIVVVKIATLDGCWEKTDTIKNAAGNYTFANLPARAFRVSVVEHSNPVIYDYFQIAGGKEIDLRDNASAVVDFIYISTPQVELQPFVTTACVGGTPVAYINQTTNKNSYKLYKTDVQVYEEYIGPTVERCYLNNFDLVIDNAIADKSIYTVSSDSLHYVLSYPAGLPNLVSPYEKTLSVTANVNGTNSTPALARVVVLGEVSLPNTFTTTTPQVPMYILRDPPGDASTATIAAGTTLCNSMSKASMISATDGASVEVDLGAKVTTYVGTPFGGVINEAEQVANVNIGGTFGAVNSTENTIETCTTIMRSYTTSGGSDVIGEDADLYVGSAINFKVGGTRELTYDAVTCSFKLGNNVRMFPDGFQTFFAYSEYQIEKDVIPTLLSLGKTADAQKWKDMVTYNHTLKKNAVLKENLSFDALAQVDDEITIERTVSNTISSEINWTLAMNETIGFEVFDVGVLVTLSVELAGSKTQTIGNTNTTTRTVSYSLADDDLGDKFTVNVKEDKVYQTPVFELVAGTSSCPWEPKTRHRSQPSLISVDGTVATNVPENTSAVFELQLGNLSPTKEEIEYEISLVTGTNPDGAEVEIDGQNIIATPIKYTIPYGETVKVLLNIYIGPFAYNYEGITIALKNACEKNDSLFTKNLAFNVSFIEPCSPVDISFPLQDFVVTPGSNNLLNVTLNEYLKNDASLELIRLQYRPIGGDGSWINISETAKADLGDVFTIKEWNTALLKDGGYEIRAVTQCVNTSLAPGISTVIKGKVERNPPELVGVPQPADGIWDPGDEISITFNEDINCDKLVAADVLGNNTIGLYDATTDALVAATFSCVGNKIVIVPTINPKDFENRTFRVLISGKDYDDAKIESNPDYQRAALRDKAGNMIPKSIKWEFAVNQNDLEWVGTDIIEVNTVLKPFSIKRQIRNRGGSITSFRMENIPFWLTISPATGTLNPGQSADVTFTFQTDLLIGDYSATPKLVGSKGSEPLGIDYRVRCAAPTFVVDNPAQYEGTMNMVIDLNIFGITSTDPSDIIVAKIDGQIRGIGQVAYYRNIPADKQRWLTFLTIYANPSDVGKSIEFNIWDGDKCNQYVEVLEQITYEEGQLVGSPLEPQSISVLNLVNKCIPLNRGFNWVSFNLDLGLGNNTITKNLSSLKLKTGAYIKTDNNFAQYLSSSNTWDGLSPEIFPTKRYMLYVTGRDTVCMKGSPYSVASQSINIKNGWNWLGYVPSTGMTVSQALAGLTPLNGDIIKSQTLFAQFVAGVGWIGNLNFLEPLKGYLLKISNAGTLVYPSTNTFAANGSEEIASGESKNIQSLLKVQASQEPEMTFDFTQYSATMNLIGEIKGMEIAQDDELRAYIDGKLVGKNKSIVDKKSKLFFQTIYFDEQKNISFKLYKADRGKEFELNKTFPFQAESIKGLVTDPVVFEVISSPLAAVTIRIIDTAIWKPSTTFPSVSIPSSIVEASENCTTYAFNSILPQANEAAPTCTPGSFEGNMSAVVKIKYNELSSFVSTNDVITFLNPTNGAVLGCGSFNNTNKLFYSTIGGVTTATESPVDIRYYSAIMKKTFLVKAGITYKNNSILGNANSPIEIDISPITITSTIGGVLTAVLRDADWTGKYCLNVFAMNCTGYSDGQTSFCFQRLNVGECIDLIVRTASESSVVSFQALKITSQSLINGGANIEYKAGNSIELKPGFEIKNGAIFTGKIEGCTNRN